MSRAIAVQKLIDAKPYATPIERILIDMMVAAIEDAGRQEDRTNNIAARVMDLEQLATRKGNDR